MRVIEDAASPPLTVAPSQLDAALAPASPGATTGPQPPLRQLAIRSGAYLAGREAIGVGVRLAGLVVVTRAIGPSDYGVYTAAAAYSLLAVLAAQMGAEVFLVRLPGPLTRRRYDEVFTFLLVTSTLVAGVGLGLSFLLAPWAKPHGVLDPVRVLIATTPINVLWAPAQAAVEREFAYRKMGLLELGGDVVLYATAVPLALVGAGAWALVAGYCAWQLWLLVGGMALAGLRPRLCWSKTTARALLRHGAGFSLSTWVLNAKSSLVTLIVAGFTGARGVGFMGFSMRLVGTVNFTERAVRRIGMAAIARARDAGSAHMSHALEEGVLLQAMAAAVPFGAFALVCRWVVPTVFGPSWTPTLPVYALLAVAAVLKMPASTQRELLFAHGRNLEVAIAAAIDLVLVVGVSVVAVRSFGVTGLGVAWIAGAGSTLYLHHAARRYARLRYRRLVVPILALVPPVLIPLAPMPWAGALLVPLALLFTTASARTELSTLAAAAMALVPRRLGAVLAHRERGAEMKTNGSTPSPQSPPPALEPVWFADPITEADTWARVEAGGPLSALGHDDHSPDQVHADTVDAETVDASAAPASATLPDALCGTDAATGLGSATVLLARIGRLLGAARGEGWRLLVAALDVGGWSERHGTRTAGELAAVAAALRAELRFDDPIARVGATVFVCAVPLVAGATDGTRIVHQLESAAARALRAAKDTSGATIAGPGVRTAHLVTELPCAREATELVRAVVQGVAS